MARVVVPSLNITVPVGVPVPGAVGISTAVNTTGCPEAEGLTEEITTDVVPSWETVCVRAVEVLVAKVVLPP